MLTLPGPENTSQMNIANNNTVGRYKKSPNVWTVLISAVKVAQAQ